MEERAGNNSFFFEEFEVDSLKRMLLKDGKSVALNSKTFDLLLTLVEHPGEILSKQHLLDLVWTNQFVEEKNLTVHVATLRKALGEGKNEHRFIATVPGTGYKFVADIKTNGTHDHQNGTNPHHVVAPVNGHLDGGAIGDDDLRRKVDVGSEVARVRDPSAESAVSSPVRKSRLFLALGVVGAAIVAAYFVLPLFNQRSVSSVAVLPFVNVGSDPRMEYLSDGITESLISGLSQSTNLKVISRSSVFRYKSDPATAVEMDLRSVAKELGVQAILTGRIEPRGEDLLITVELVNGRDNSRIWGEHYNRKYSEILSVESQIAGDISTKLRLKLTGEREIAKRYTDNIKAFEFYMLGRSYVHKRTREDMNVARQYYEQAIKEDQNYVLAYSGLAEVYDNLGNRGYMPAAEACTKFEEAARKAVSLDPDLADGHAMLGSYYMSSIPFDFEKGQSEYRKAIDLSPNLALAHLYMALSLMRVDKLEEGLTEMRKAHELDPFSAIINKQTAVYYYLKRDWARSLELVRQANQTGPAFTSSTEVFIDVQNKLYDEALSEIANAKLSRKDDPLLIGASGAIYAAKGKRSEAFEAISQLKALAPGEPRFAQSIAKIYMLLGDTEEALATLDEGVNQGTLMSFFANDPLWDPIRYEPRFREMLSRMRIPKSI